MGIISGWSSPIRYMTRRYVKKSEAQAQEGQFVLYPQGLSRAQKKLDRLNRKAQKHGVPPASFRVVQEVQLTVYEEGDEPTNERATLFVVEPEGELFKVTGYRLVATLEHTSEGNLIRKAPGYLDFDTTPYRHVAAYCGHCNTTRARKDTFVIEGPEGVKQVGRNCLADFLRKDEVASLLLAADIMDALRDAASEGEEYTGGGGGWGGYALIPYLATAYREVKRNGFRPTSFDYPTRAAVGFAMGERPKYSGDTAGWDEAQPQEEDFEGAKVVIAFVEAMESESDYAHNLKMAFGKGFVDFRSTGLVVSSVGVMFKDEAKKREQASPRVNEHYGEPGKRYEVELEILRIHSFDTEFGDMEILVMRDQDGRGYAWKTRATAFEKGQRVAGKATVKGHSEYKDRKQTDLSRCSFKVVSGPTLWAHLMGED